MNFFKPLPHNHQSVISLPTPLVAGLLAGTVAMAIICFCCVYWRVMRNPETYAYGQIPSHDQDQRLIP